MTFTPHIQLTWKINTLTFKHTFHLDFVKHSMSHLVVIKPAKRSLQQITILYYILTIVFVQTVEFYTYGTIHQITWLFSGIILHWDVSNNIYSWAGNGSGNESEPQLTYTQSYFGKFDWYLGWQWYVSPLYFIHV